VICSQESCFEKDNLLFYPLDYKIALKGIILGPLCDLNVDELKEVIPVGCELEVIKSRLAFRSFNIVEQKQIKRIKMKGKSNNHSTGLAEILPLNN
jgi:hypothetical protein